MPSFAVKAPPPLQAEAGDVLGFHEKSMWAGQRIGAGDEVFLFAAEHMGGRGLYARGIVVEAERGVGSRVVLRVRVTERVHRALGRFELRAFRDRGVDGPQAEIDHRLYRQATNKIAGVSEAAAAWLASHF